MRTEEALKLVNQKVFESRGSWLTNVETFIEVGEPENPQNPSCFSRGM